MNDTVLIALITFLAALVGSVSGILTTVLTSKFQRKTQMQQIALTAYLEARLTAYTSFFSALESWALSQNHATISGVFRCAANAGLVASPQTILLLSDLQEHVSLVGDSYEKYPPDARDKFEISKARLFQSMHTDLLRFELPHVCDASG